MLHFKNEVVINFWSWPNLIPYIYNDTTLYKNGRLITNRRRIQNIISEATNQNEKEMNVEYYK